MRLALFYFTYTIWHLCILNSVKPRTLWSDGTMLSLQPVQGRCLERKNLRKSAKLEDMYILNEMYEGLSWPSLTSKAKSMTDRFWHLAICQTNRTH